MKTFTRNMRKYWGLYVLLIPGLLWLILFKIAPFYGVAIAFQNYKPWLGIANSEWVGFKNFIVFFSGKDFGYIMLNVIKLNSLKLLFGFPLPIILALALSNIRNRTVRKTMQTITFFPQFFSWIVIYGIIYSAFSYNFGFINNFLEFIGLERIALLAEPQFAVPVFIGSYIWKYLGWNSIIYLATITNIDPTYFEAAAMDGATRWQRLKYVTIPFLFPVMMVILMFQIGNMLYGDFEQNIILAGRNPLYFKAIDMFESYVYRLVFGGQNAYSMGTAIGLFQGVLGTLLIIVSNKVIKKLGYSGLW